MSPRRTLGPLAFLLSLALGCTGSITGESGGGALGRPDGGESGADAGRDDAGEVEIDAGVSFPDATPQSICGDTICAADESCASCELDCGPCQAVCGDGTCEGNSGESCTACSADCDTTEVVCGNGACESGESSSSCYGDCGPEVWPSDWSSWETEVLEGINAERAAGTDCPNGDTKDPLPPLTMDDQLQAAARLHSWDMSFSDYFDHTSCNGRSPWQRAAAAGTSASGETIGGGYSSPAAMVSGWMNSAGHCAILMSSRTKVGVGYASVGGRKWTALFR